MIFYFSGTGNSSYIAKEMAISTGDTIVAISANEIDADNVYSLEEEERIGFVFPVYWYSLPTIVERFVKHLHIKGYKAQYVYAIATYGFAGGNVMKQLTTLLKAKGIPLTGKFGVKMIDNYIVGYPIINKEKQAMMKKQAITKLAELSFDIIEKREQDKIHKGTLAFITPFTKRAYQSAKHTHKFYTTNACNGCGLCEKNCPCNVIHIVEKKPRWEGDCTFCLGCIHGCNQTAIQYGKGTLKRERYQY